MDSNLASKEGGPSLAAGSVCLAVTPPPPLPPDRLCSRPALGQEEKAAYWCPGDAQPRGSAQGPNLHTAQPLPASSDPTAQNSPASPRTPRHPSHPTIPPTVSGKSALPWPTADCGQATLTGLSECPPLTGATTSSLLGFQVGGKLPEESSRSLCYLPGSCLGVRQRGARQYLLC